ncbi:MAG: carboxypeptidase-like regulatory domain-containing protein [Solirubrobacterales bacterium]
MSRCSRILLVLALATLCFAMVTGPASATRTIEVKSCAGEHSSAIDWSEQGNNIFEMTDRCIEGGGLEMDVLDSGVFADAEQFWTATVPTGVRVSSFSFDVSGGDTSNGVSYWASACDGCGVKTDIGPRGPGDGTQRIDVALPDEAIDRLEIGANCDGGLLGYCLTSHAPPLSITNIRVVMTDSTPPAVGGIVAGATMSGDGSFLGWTNERAIPVTAGVQDDGFGVAGAGIEIGDSFRVWQYWDFSDGCLAGSVVNSLQQCGALGVQSGFIDASSLVDGTYDVFARGTDLADNLATFGPDRLGIDRTAPLAPTGLRAELNKPGWPGQHWTSDPAVALSWDAPPAPVDEERESPVTRARILTRKVDSTATSARSLDLPVDGDQEELLASDGLWQFSVGFIDAAKNPGIDAATLVGLDRDAPPAPQLDDIGLVSRGDLIAGKVFTWDPPAVPTSLESGICGYVVRADNSSATIPDPAIDETTVRPAWRLPASLGDGEAYLHVRAVSCAGVASPTATADVTVDSAPPTIAVSGLPASGVWANHVVHAQIVAADTGSGVARVGVSLDGAQPTWTDDDHLAYDLPVGAHTLAVFAEDVSGNQSSPLQYSVLSDPAAPVATFAAADSSDPAAVSTRVVDPVSGLADVAVEIRRVDAGASATEREWRVLGGAEAIARGTTVPVVVQRRLDDDVLPPGDYELRVNATDIAGNNTAISSYSVRTVRLPLRGGSEISAAVADIDRVCRTAAGKSCRAVSGCAKKLRCREVDVVRRDSASRVVVRGWDARSALVGEALDDSGAPIAGADVVIRAAPTGRDATVVGHVTTDTDGRYEYRISKGPSRTFTAQLAVDTLRRPSSATARRATKTEITFRPTPARLRSGRVLALSGRVLHPEWLPVGGLTVTYQFKAPSGNFSMAGDAFTDAKGRFTYAYPWPARAQRSTAWIRARVTEFPDGWPFEAGYSAWTKITVLPAR